MTRKRKRVICMGIPLNEDFFDPFRAGRLRASAKAGNEEARRELERMENTPMFTYESDNPKEESGGED